jgi:hypothetical protein
MQRKQNHERFEGPFLNSPTETQTFGCCLFVLEKHTECVMIRRNEESSKGSSLYASESRQCLMAE